MWSDFVTAAVRTGAPESGAAGLSGLIISLKSEGVTCRRLYNSGVSASGSTFIEFNDVKVPVENLIGGPKGVGQGFRMIMTSKPPTPRTRTHQRLTRSQTSITNA